MGRTERALPQLQDRARSKVVGWGGVGWGGVAVMTDRCFLLTPSSAGQADESLGAGSGATLGTGGTGVQHAECSALFVFRSVQVLFLMEAGGGE